MEELLKVYEQYQFVDSETVSITTNFGGVYPTLSFYIKNVEYSDIVIWKPIFCKFQRSQLRCDYVINRIVPVRTIFATFLLNI